VSEKSTRKAPDYTDESRAAPNRSVFRPQLQHWSCNTHQERYNSSESVQKKEIPAQMRPMRPIPAGVNTFQEGGAGVKSRTFVSATCDLPLLRQRKSKHETRVS
jgi:hypothetical protein